MSRTAGVERGNKFFLFPLLVLLLKSKQKREREREAQGE